MNSNGANIGDRQNTNRQKERKEWKIRRALSIGTSGITLACGSNHSYVVGCFNANWRRYSRRRIYRIPTTVLCICRCGRRGDRQIYMNIQTRTSYCLCVLGGTWDLMQLVPVIWYQQYWLYCTRIMPMSVYCLWMNLWNRCLKCGYNFDAFRWCDNDDADDDDECMSNAWLCPCVRATIGGLWPRFVSNILYIQNHIHSYLASIVCDHRHSLANSDCVVCAWPALLCQYEFISNNVLQLFIWARAHHTPIRD